MAQGREQKRALQTGHARLLRYLVSDSLCPGETGKEESPLAALARASPGVSAAQGPTTFQCQLHETAPNAQGILEIGPKRAFEVFNPLSWSACTSTETDLRVWDSLLLGDREEPPVIGP